MITDHWRGRTSFLSSEINIFYFYFLLIIYFLFFFIFYFLFFIYLFLFIYLFIYFYFYLWGHFSNSSSHYYYNFFLHMYKYHTVLINTRFHLIFLFWNFRTRCIFSCFQFPVYTIYKRNRCSSIPYLMKASMASRNIVL